MPIVFQNCRPQKKKTNRKGNGNENGYCVEIRKLSNPLHIKPKTIQHEANAANKGKHLNVCFFFSVQHTHTHIRS